MCDCVFVDGFLSHFYLNCRLQIEHVSDCAESDDDPLALPFRSLSFLSASHISFVSNCAAPLLMRQRHFVRSCAACSQDSVGILISFREALRVPLYRFFWPP